MAKTTAPKLWIQGEPKPDIAKALSQFNDATTAGHNARRFFQNHLTHGPYVPSNAERLQAELNSYYDALPPEAFK